MADETNPLAGTTGIAAPNPPVSMQPPSSVMTDPSQSAENLGPYSTPPAPQIPAPGTVDDPGNAPTTQTIPSETAPNSPDIERQMHESRWHHILTAVGRVLGGGTSTHIKTDEKGNVSVTHDPSTTGEMWRRVAFAALGGAAQGVANSQGPGGAVRAAAAGTQYGMNIPKQEQQYVDAEATAQQKRIQFNADHAKMDQDYVMNAEAMRQKNIKFSEDQSDRYHAIQKEIEDNGAEPLGHFDGVSDLPSFSAKYPQAMKGHITDADHYLFFTPTFDAKTGMQTGSDVAYMSRPEGERVMKNPPPYPVDRFDSKTNTIVTDMTQPQKGIKANEYASVVKATQVANSKLALDVAEKLNKPPITQQQAIIQKHIQLNPTNRAKALNDAADEIQRNEVAQKTAGRAVTPVYGSPPPGTPTTTPTGENIVGREFGGGDPASSFETNARLIQQGKMAPSQIKPMRGKGQPTNADFIARADQIDRANGGSGMSPATAEARYKNRVKVESDYGPSGTTGQKIGSFSTMLEHLGDVHDSVQELRNTGSPYLNKTLNTLSRDVAGNANVGPAAIRAEAPSREYTNFLNNNHALNNDEKAELPNLLNAAQTPAQQQANSKQMMKTAIDKLDPIFQGYRTATGGEESPTTLTPRAVQALKSAGLYDYAMQKLHPNGLVPAQQRQTTQQNGGQNTPPAAPKGPTTAGPDFQPETPPPGEPIRKGQFFGMGPKGRGWYR